jgi:hypothetical protein
MKRTRTSLLCFILCLGISAHAVAQTKMKTDTAKQQIRHVEIVTFKPGTSDADKHVVDKSFRQFAGAFPLIQSFEWGWDENDKAQASHVYITTFNNKGDLTTYNASPQHQAITKTTPVDHVTTVNYMVNQ